MSVTGDREVDAPDGFSKSIYDVALHQSAYIFSPFEKNDQHDRPTKRRKVVEESPNVSPSNFLYPRLSHGKESPELAARRQQVYKNVWESHKALIDPILNRYDDVTANAVDKFVREVDLSETQDKIPAAVLVTGASVGSTSKLLEQLVDSWTDDGICLLQLTSDQAPNIKLVLKAIIRGVIVRVDGTDGYQSFFNLHKKSIPLNYDLELLYRYLIEKGLKRIVLSFTDSEAFDAHLLAELLSVLSAWKDRLPIVLIFQVSTSLELFEARLPSSALRLLDGALFQPENQHDPFQEIFEKICFSGQHGQKSQIWLGADAARALLEQSKEQLVTPESLALSIKYGLMSHCFANPLSSLLEDSAKWKGNDLKYICNCLRSTPSFRRHAEKLFESDEADLLNSMLEDDDVLFLETSAAIEAGGIAIRNLCQAIQNLQKIVFTGIATKVSAVQFTDLYIDAMSGRLADSSLYHEPMVSIKRASSETLSQLLDLGLHFPTAELTNELSSIQQDLKTLLSATPASSLPIRSAHDPLTATQTTVSQHNNRISLSSTPKKATALETKYTAILTRYHDLLTASYFDDILGLNPTRDLFACEAFIYTSSLSSSSSAGATKLPLTTAFSPRPRFAIERALSAPADYLVSDGPTTQPATAILWRLWCDAGALVNVRDLWGAFWSVIGPPPRDDDDVDDGGGGPDGEQQHHRNREDENNDDESEDELAQSGTNVDGRTTMTKDVMDERMGLSLFYRSLAELKLLGFVKQSKRKVDCVGKAGWKGL